MKKYLISLEKDNARRELFFAQSDTADFEVFHAINTMHETEETLPAVFDVVKFTQRYGRKTTKGEAGCTLSHLKVYEKIANDASMADDEYCLICEDDALFADNFQHNLEAIGRQNLPVDLLLLGQSKIPDFDDFELSLNYPCTFSCWQKPISGTQYKYAYPYRDYFAGTVAYLIRKGAAKRFLAHIEDVPFWLADDFRLFSEHFQIRTMVVRPLMVIENPQTISNLESFRGSLKNNLFSKLLKYPLKKFLAVMRNY